MKISKKREKLFLSFSGGLSSAFMTKMVFDTYQDKYDLTVLFANTGQERGETLDFVNNCDKAFGWNVIWLEAEVHHKTRVGTTHKVVTYDTADRSGKNFEEMIKKYGIPNQAYPHCTRELKLQPMYSYLRSIGWSKGDYSVAIGIRSDETRRVSKQQEQNRII